MRTVRGKVLVVDDEADARLAVADLLMHEGFEVETAGDAFKALGKLENFAPDLVVSDLRMPGMDGLELMQRLQTYPDPPRFVLLTGVKEVSSAVAAMRQGAADYLTKPVNSDELVVIVQHQLEHRRALEELRALRARVHDRPVGNGMVGASAAMHRVYEGIEQVARSRSTVLITGESGTGKELVAAAIHAASPRASGPFIKVHCASLAETLLESELFGHERGAFTGAVARREGRFAAAHRGTLFLDEIGEISPSIQVKLLRFLQEHEFEPVGGDRPVRVDVRVLAATHRDLPAMVVAGTFREDLFYRLNVISIEVPALRDHLEDLPLLAHHFFERYTHDNGKPLEGISAAALGALRAHGWPGNVRELAHAIERAVVMSAGPMLELDDLPPTVRGLAVALDGGIAIPGSTLHEVERYTILKTLEATGGSTTKAAAILDVTRRTIQYRLQEYRRADKTMGPALATPTSNADEPDDV
ncbi:MAG: sigma-54 dependent transcriptional regulator [Proteobacteria bacterium]|nr:sigma-54 dependent transcriptional regulator [Pseudomonadota bacterium]